VIAATKTSEAELAEQKGDAPHSIWQTKANQFADLKSVGMDVDSYIAEVYLDKLRKWLPVKNALIFDSVIVACLSSLNSQESEFKMGRLLKRKLISSQVTEKLERIGFIGHVQNDCCPRGHYFGVIFDLCDRKATFFDDFYHQPHKSADHLEVFGAMLRFVNFVTKTNDVYSKLSLMHGIYQEPGDRICLLSVLRYFTCYFLIKQEELKRKMDAQTLRNYVHFHAKYEAMYPNKQGPEFFQQEHSYIKGKSCSDSWSAQ